MISFLKNKYNELMTYNRKAPSLAIYSDLSKKQDKKVKEKFNLYLNGLITLMTLVYLYLVFVTYDILLENSLYLILHLVFSIIIILPILYIKMNKLNDYSIAGILLISTINLISPIALLLSFYTYILLINLSKKIIILESTTNGITTKVNLNLQEFDYKDGKLHSCGERMATRKEHFSNLSIFNSHLGDWYYKGQKYKENKTEGFNSNDFKLFKESVDLKTTKNKINNF